MDISRRNSGMSRVARKALAPLLAVLLVLGASSVARGDADDMPNSRLGYRWTPQPPKQSFAMPDPVVFQWVKYGGGAVAGLWVLRKLFGGRSAE